MRKGSLKLAIMLINWVLWMRQRFYLNSMQHLNPNSVNAHNQLGRILLKTNQRERAKNSFKKTLEIDPKNDFAIKKINALNDIEDK